MSVLAELLLAAARAPLHAESVGRGLLAFAEVSDAEVSAFESSRQDVLVRIPCADFWLCCSEVPPAGEDGRPWVTVRSLRDLGRSFADALATGVFEGIEVSAEVDDVAANDFGDDVSW